ncbi:MAG: hypothetical protein AAF468_19000 [Pseudomonadota bacterium]
MAKSNGPKLRAFTYTGADPELVVTSGIWSLLQNAFEHNIPREALDQLVSIFNGYLHLKRAEVGAARLKEVQELADKELKTARDFFALVSTPKSTDHASGDAASKFNEWFDKYVSREVRVNVGKLSFHPALPPETEQAIELLLDRTIINVRPDWRHLCDIAGNVQHALEKINDGIDLDTSEPYEGGWKDGDALKH